MKTTNTIKNFAVRFVAMIAVVLLAGNAWGANAVYTVTSTSAVSASNAPANSSSSYANTYTTNYQTTSGNTATLTLTSLGGISISNITLSMHSNSGNGTGMLSYSTDGGSNWTYLVGSSGSGLTFNNSDWNGSYTTSWVDISKNVNLNNVTQLKVRIEVTNKSLYCQSFTISYSAGCSTKLTITKAGQTNGTFSLRAGAANGSELTGTGKNEIGNCSSQTVYVVPSPATGYVASACTATNKTSGPTASGSNWYIVYPSANSNTSSTVTVTFSGKQCALVFNQNNGTGGQSSNLTATYGSAMPTISETPTREHYNFLGYYDGTGNNATQYYTSTGASARNWDKNTTSNTTLYAKWEEKGIARYVTNCCTPLGSINGSISWTNGTSATLTWANDVNVSGYSVTCKQGETNKGTVGSITGTTPKSCTVTGLTAGQAYTFTINASGDATHCDASQVISATAPKITATADLEDFGYAQGSNPEEQSFTVSGTALTGNLTVSASAYFLIKVGTGEWSAAGGEKSITVSTPPSDLSSTTIYVKATTGLNEGDNPSGNIRISGGGAANVDVPVSATITSACAVDPTIGAATLKAGGAFGLDGVAVSVTGMNPGTNCTWTDYGFYWGTVDNKKAHKVEIGNSGNATSFETTLAFTAPAQFAAGTTYYFCAYGKNAKSGAEIICGTEASFTPYTVSYNANGGTGEVATVVVNAGGSVTLPNASAFTLNCNDLTKWALNSASGTQYDPEDTYSSINANAEFFAIWNVRTYTISYAAGNTPTNGGNITGSHDNDTKTCGVSLTLPGVTFYSTGYTQTGWKKTINGASKTNNLSGSYGVDADQTFYPFWTINTYNVTKGTKTGCSGNDFTLSASSVDHYGSITVTATPDAAHKGSAHVTVYPAGNATVSGTTISNIIGNITVSVSFAAKEAATVKLSIAGSESVVVSDGLEGDSYTLPSEAAECPDLGLYGWYKGTYSHATTAPSGDNYKSKGQTVQLTAGENKFYAVYATVGAPTNTYTKITTTGELESGDYLLIAYYGFSFIEAMKNTINASDYMDEVNVNGKVNNTSNPTSVTLDSDNPAIRWKITKSPSSITIYNEAISQYFCGSTGTPALNTTSEDFSYSVDGGNWTLVTNGKTVYYSNYWYVGTPSNAKPIYLFKRNTSLAGPYTTDPNCTTHELSYEDPGTEGTIVLGKTVLGEGKTTTATATPSEHYTFSHWTISGTGALLSDANANPVTVTMGTADATLTAHFTEKEKCTVVFKNNGGIESSATYWLGENPVAPLLTDGVSNDACDETSDAHYGWTRNLITGNVADQATLDARTGSDVVYTKAATLPAITAGDDGTTITYHAVWAQATGSGSGNYELVEEDLGTEWAGDYLIAYSSTIFADGRVGGKGTGGIGAQSTHVTPGDNLSAKGKVVAASWGDTYYVTLEEISENSNTYVLKTQDDVYNYQSSNANGLASTDNKATAANYPITVNFESSSDIELALGGGAAGAIFHYNNSVLGSGGDVFRYYKNGGMQPIYLYKKMGGTTYSTFLTTCCDKNVTLATNSPANGSITFSPSGTIATCGADAATRQTTMTVTPNTGYYLSSWSTTGVTPASLSTDIAYGSTSNSGAQATTVTFTQNTTAGTYTANATFTAIPVSSLTLHAIKKDNTSATIFDETGNNVALSLYPTEGKTASPADPLGHTVKIEFGAVLPANALNKGYTWSATVNGAAVGWSSNDLATNAVLEFNKSSGKVVAKAAGTAEIIITADDGSGVTAKVTITVANVALSTLNVAKSSTMLYLGEAEDIAVTYDPVNTTTKGYTTGSYTYVTVGRSNNKITLTGKAVTPGEPERVTLTSSDAGAKTATIDVTVKPLPKVTFVDNLQGKTDFSNWGSDGVVSSTVTDGVVTHTKPTPSHTDISDPGSSYNTCERQHLHLVGWILSTWADAHPGATHEQIVGANVSNGAGTFLEAGADFNVETYNGNTYYAVWAKVE